MDVFVKYANMLIYPNFEIYHNLLFKSIIFTLIPQHNFL